MERHSRSVFLYEGVGMQGYPAVILSMKAVFKHVHAYIRRAVCACSVWLEQV